jgi:hypothetical protein
MPNTLMGQFSASDLEFDAWVDQMIRDGHLYSPNITALLARQDGWGIKLKNVGCAQVTGNRDLVNDVHDHFCEFVKKAEQLSAMEMATDVARNICNDHRICKLAVSATFNFFGLFKDVDDVTKLCHEMFDALDAACPDGGVAEAEVSDPIDGHTETGHLESAYALEDSSTCNPSATQECFDKTIP